MSFRVGGGCTLRAFGRERLEVASDASHEAVVGLGLDDLAPQDQDGFAGEPAGLVRRGGVE